MAMRVFVDTMMAIILLFLVQLVCLFFIVAGGRLIAFVIEFVGFYKLLIGGLLFLFYKALSW